MSKILKKKKNQHAAGVLKKLQLALNILQLCFKVKPDKLGEARGDPLKDFYPFLLPYHHTVWMCLFFLPGMTSLYPSYLLGWAFHVFYYLSKDWISLLGNVFRGGGLIKG